MSQDGGINSVETTSLPGSSSEAEEDVAKRRSKNRVNARRSRERKRLLLDTLQQEHFQLHQENKRVKAVNAQLREVIATLKSRPQNSDAWYQKKGGAGPAPVSAQHMAQPGGGATLLPQSMPNPASVVGTEASMGALGAAGGQIPTSSAAGATPSVTPSPSMAGLSTSNTGGSVLDVLAHQLILQQQLQQQQANAQRVSMNLPMLNGGLMPNPSAGSGVLSHFLLANAFNGPSGLNAGLVNPNTAILPPQQQKLLPNKQEEGQETPQGNAQQSSPSLSGSERPASSDKQPGPSVDSSLLKQPGLQVSTLQGSTPFTTDAGKSPGVGDSVAGDASKTIGTSTAPMTAATSAPHALNALIMANATSLRAGGNNTTPGFASFLQALGGQQPQQVPNASPDRKFPLTNQTLPPQMQQGSTMPLNSHNMPMFRKDVPTATSTGTPAATTSAPANP